jgi:hypothetical protein
MDHDAICDCLFLPRCETFHDPQIDQERKTSLGFGCREQSDVYRARHCRRFACAYLSMVVTDAMGSHPAKPAGEEP